jgi:hypothetical protein
MPFWKPSKTKRTIERRKTRRVQVSDEQKNKLEVRLRDHYKCRFPLCGCRSLRLQLESSHVVHKGMGGNPAGDRSTVDQMVLLCSHRHRDGIVAIHKGTLRLRYLSSFKASGPVAWEVPASILHHTKTDKWIEVARETRVQQLEPLSDEQLLILDRLSSMVI